jgi:transposase
MKRFVEGEDRRQAVLLPEYLDDYVSEENPVRVIDVFVDELDLGVLGFAGVVPEATGRPAYHPGLLLKIYVYGVNAAPSQQVSLTDPDARSMATSGRGSGMVGYNIQAAVDAQHHLIVAHEVSNVGTDRTQLANMAGQAKAAMGADTLDVLADGGYFSGEEVLACEPLGVTPYVPKPLTSGAKAKGRFGKQDFVYVAEDDIYRCPAGERLTRRFTSVEDGMTLHVYWTTRCADCPLKQQCTSGKERRIKRWEHEAVIDAMQERLDRRPDAMRIRCATGEHPFGTLKAWMGATHFRTRTLEKVKTEMSLHVLAYNLKRVIAMLGPQSLIEAIRA